MAQENKWAGDCYRRGNDAMQKQNWDLALEMFSTCVKLVPDNLVYRQYLRQCAKKKYGDNGKGAGTFEKTKLMGIRSRVKKARQAENWEEASKAIEEGLYLNPWDTQLNLDLADVSKKLDRGEIAKFAYMEAIRTDQKNKEIYVALANLLRERAEYDDAVKVWEQVAKLDPSDLTAMRKITEIQTEKTTHRGGYEDAENTRSVMANKNLAAKGGGVGGNSIAPGESVETDLKHAIRKEPGRLEPYLKLAAHYKATKRYQDSYDSLQKAFEVSKNDPSVGEQLEDAELLLMKHGLEEAKEKANKSSDPEDRKRAAELSTGLRDRKIEVLTKRVERYPANLAVKFELAELLMQLQKWGLAIPLLQKSAQDPRHKARSYVSLGKCFVYDKKLQLARGQFERAVPDLNVDTDPDTYKECHYLLGRVCEEMKDPPSAEKHYGEVLVIDYEYKDTRERLERLQGGEG
ncbi:tetratricopeptide repeat protein [Planctomicrobium piriforme]|uniref:tetratricopeptide repeat protein n=1 Tax=Planctomicrobium piriforme TaxID=1576369 RepID=UPI00111398B4|nr:tetratricopeptide repeat protein [Planctomicrobium piriforme]